ncbi:MAG TPA: hypothetical protein VI306_20130 [Pyrinomonadaceae bacterium]
MNERKRVVVFALLIVLFQSSCHKAPTRNRIDENHFPRVILWAWERPEDLQFLDPQRFAVAFLAQTLTLKNDDVIYSPRHQPLKLPPNAKLIAVTRIESQKITHERPLLSEAQRRQLVERIKKTLELPNVSALQLDFDAVTSERNFYQQLLDDLRQTLPDNVPISMTALASFCIGDKWLTDLPVDEAVPMAFRMGTDSDRIKNFLTSGNDFRDGLCRRSYGVALDEPVTTSFAKERRVYVFNSRPWVQSDLAVLEERFGK